MYWSICCLLFSSFQYLCRQRPFYEAINIIVKKKIGSTCGALPLKKEKLISRISSPCFSSTMLSKKEKKGFEKPFYPVWEILFRREHLCKVSNPKGRIQHFEPRLLNRNWISILCFEFKPQFPLVSMAKFFIRNKLIEFTARWTIMFCFD